MHFDPHVLCHLTFFCCFPFPAERTKRNTSGSDLERITHIAGLFAPLTGVWEWNTPDVFHPSLQLRPGRRTSSPGSPTTPACLHLLVAAPWLETGTPCKMPAEADGVSQLCKWPGSVPRMGRGAGRRAGWWIALQGAVIFGKVLWKHRCRWCRERTSADGLTLSVGSCHVGCDCLHSRVRGHFLLTARGFTPGAQLARGTYASWTSKVRAIQKHKTLRVRPNPPSQVVFFLSSEKTEEAIH